MTLSAQRGLPPGELPASGTGKPITLAFEFSNGRADVVVGLLAGDRRLNYTALQPYAYTLSALDGVKAPQVCSLTVDVLTRDFGGAFTSIVGAEVPTLATESESEDTAISWPAIVLGKHVAAEVATLTVGPAPKKLTLSVYCTVV